MFKEFNDYLPVKNFHPVHKNYNFWQKELFHR